MKEHCLLGPQTPKSDQNLKMSGEHTFCVPSAVEEAWPQPRLRRVARQVPGRRHWGRVGLVWQTAQGHSSLNPQSCGRYAGAQLRYLSKSEAEGRTPWCAWLKSGKMKAWKFITSTEQITSGGKWDRREFLSIRWLIRSLLHQTYPFCALVTEGLHASERHTARPSQAWWMAG